MNAKMYLYSAKLDDDGNEKAIDAYPCFICKKMIVNSGISQLVSRQADESIKIYSIEDWAKDWQEKDLIDDMEQYGVKTIKQE